MPTARTLRISALLRDVGVLPFVLMGAGTALLIYELRLVVRVFKA